NTMTYVLFDIGGTKTRVAVSEDLTTLAKVTSFKTPASFADGMKKIAEAIGTLVDKKEIKAIAGGIRGLLTEEKTGIYNDPVLSKWAGKSVVAEREKRNNTPVCLENDAAIAGLGEAVYGAGKGLEIVADHTVSTGVGGAKIENGDIDHTSTGFEPG